MTRNTNITAIRRAVVAVMRAVLAVMKVALAVTMAVKHVSYYIYVTHRSLLLYFLIKPFLGT